MHTTLNELRKHKPCKGGISRLMRGLGKTKFDDAPVYMSQILKYSGTVSAAWSLRAWPDKQAVKEWDREVWRRTVVFTLASLLPLGLLCRICEPMFSAFLVVAHPFIIFYVYRIIQAKELLKRFA